MVYLWLLAGLCLLIVSGDFLVKGAADIAKRFKISSLVIGMTVVAFGTSAPEMIVSLEAAIQGNSGIAIGNVVGSNIANIGLILGLTAIIAPMAINKISIRRDWPVMTAASLALMAVLYNGEISRIEGFIFVAALILYVIYSLRADKKSDQMVEQPKYSSLLSILFIIASCVGLYFGANLLVGSASEIALSWGISQRVIGITIVAFGTSVPELVASVIAAIKKESDISIGNIIGSNLFNILAVLGFSSMIHPIEVGFADFNSDLLWMILFAFLLLLGLMPWKKNLQLWRINRQIKNLFQIEGGTLSRISGAVFLILYILYVYLLF